MTQICPDEPYLDQQIALVTGGTNGIGAGIVKGLKDRGASVMSASRGSKGEHESDSFLRLDLGDLAAIKNAVDRLKQTLGNKRLSIVCFNAGISAHNYATSKDGLELTYAVNCLGHHYLFQLLEGRNLLSADATIVFTTGDIYCLADDCTSDFRFKGRGIQAYCRSKLGNLWQMQNLANRYPHYRIVAVHPGVVASNLEGPLTGLKGMIMRALLLTPDQGAQASLIAATQVDIPSGSYFHNTRGLVTLRSDDPANDGKKSAKYITDIEEILSFR